MVATFLELLQIWLLWAAVGPLLGVHSQTVDTVGERAWELFGLVNELRAQGFTCPKGSVFAANSEPLKFDCRLWRASKFHSEEMASEGYLNHTSLDGRSYEDRARGQGISADGENLAEGLSSASAILQQWKDSDRQCRKMMNPNFRVVAIGYASKGHRHAWTQMLKTTDVDLDVSCYPNATTTFVSESSTTTDSTTVSTVTTTVTGAATTDSTTASTVTTMVTGAATTDSTTGSGSEATGSRSTSRISDEPGTSFASSTGVETTSMGGLIATSSTATGSPSSTSQSETSISHVNDSTQPVVEEGPTTTTAALESIEGKLVLEVSDPERFLAASMQLQGPLKSFLSELLEINASRVAISSMSPLDPLGVQLRGGRRLGLQVRRLMAGMAVDYVVQVEGQKVEEVITLLESGNSTRRSVLQATLQDDLAEMNMTVKVVDVQVLQTSLEKLVDQAAINHLMASVLLPTLIGAAGGAVCGLCIWGSVFFLCLRRPKEGKKKTKGKTKLPHDLPVIHGHLNAGVPPKIRSSKTDQTMDMSTKSITSTIERQMSTDAQSLSSLHIERGF
ncbi:unnamed protein product [Durusdinium trenchii]|uniref:SCP domain-containing protein n=1 Tax=Durusdinium trenchii TaxID=1381693 RepID=A0ABP0HX64_9DINO